ncbi:MAG: SCE4755 family polysaccharide monooxygenase-like protein [Candidatus Binatia bacterium]
MSRSGPRVILLALALASTSFAPRPARAHFVLRLPASWRDQDVLGNPQKSGPCGNEGTAATTGMVTGFAPGETITITLDETIFHPGHYRVALAVNHPSELPAEPPVTPGATDCGSVPIVETPAFPVLADGALLHTDVLSGTHSFQVTLPSDVTCTHCTLQVLEFMSDHGAPCFYHHCADISIGAGIGACATDADCADADACTRDICNAAVGCVAQPLTLADVDAGFLGVLPAAACASEPVPSIIGTLFGQAGTLVARAAGNPAKAQRFVNRASNKLRRAAKKVTKTQGRSLSAECGTALGVVLGQARTRVECLLGGT